MSKLKHTNRMTNGFAHYYQGLSDNDDEDTNVAEEEVQEEEVYEFSEINNISKYSNTYSTRETLVDSLEYDSDDYQIVKSKKSNRIEQISQNGSFESKDAKVLEKFLIYIYDKDLLNSNGGIYQKILKQEFTFYLQSNRITSVNYNELDQLLAKHKFISTKFEEADSFILKKKKLENLIKDSPAAKEFEDIKRDCFQYVLTMKRILGTEYLSVKKSCFICRVTFEDSKALAKHLNRRHGDNFEIRQKLKMGDLTYQRIFEITYEVGDILQEIIFDLYNISDEHYRIQNIYLYNGKILVNLPYTVHEQYGMRIETHCNKMYFNQSRFKYSILIQALDGKHEIIEQHHFYVREAFFKNIRKYGVDKIKFETLDEYKPRVELRDIPRYKHNLITPSLAPDNYIPVMQTFVELEDWATQKEFLDYDNYNQKLKVYIDPDKKNLYQLDLKNMCKIPPKIEEESVDRIILIDMNCINFNLSKDIEFDISKQNIAIIATFNKIEKEQLIIEVKHNRILLMENKKYFIRFKPNRTTVRMQRRVLDLGLELDLSPLFFPKAEPEHKNLEFSDFNWFHKSIASNWEQQQAVRHIINKTSYPIPYVLIGPPGTGKTMTLVEAISQIWKLKPQSNILVTTPSNSACDEIAERLVRYIPPKDLLRYYSCSAQKRLEDINHLVLQISNFYVDNIEATEYMEILRSYRIVLVTLTKSGWLNLAGIDPDHFDYVIIDECGSATEPSTLIPIAGSVASKSEILANVIIAGDPKQLGPVLASTVTCNLGFDKSMLERFLEMKLYKKNIDNPRIITKLIRNFRSHPSILKLPNDLFYRGQLLCSGNSDVIDCALNWKFLPNKQFPIIFESVIGITETEQDHSSFNLMEMDKVLEYIGKLLRFGINGKSIMQTDIGVVTPYRKQCLKLRMKFNDKKWNDIEVGSVEQYQGREKKVVILTTVRSNTDNVGFLNNPKRFNVALTRAQSLLIIIGNANTLQQDTYWFRLIQYCIKNNCFNGDRMNIARAGPKRRGRK